MTTLRDTGIVIIGRNEGARLITCLSSLEQSELPVVYVDSGSTDGSIEAAERFGARVVRLPLDRPFTAGRARNAGFEYLTGLHPELQCIQFVDGDCQVAAGWLDFAREHLQSHPRDALVCGRRKEIHPEQSLYNQLCDIEWNTPVGEVEACGGDFMVRAQTFQDSQGFNPTLIAGEEPELCYRLRGQGWTIRRVDRLMTHHDAAMTGFGQWLRRSSRAGYAYAAGALLHRHDGNGYCRRENLRIIFWAAALPLAALLGALTVSPWMLALLLTYPLQFIRCMQQARSSAPEVPAGRYALFLLLGKWPEFYGQLLCLKRQLSGQQATLIEYK